LVSYPGPGPKLKKDVLSLTYKYYSQIFDSLIFNSCDIVPAGYNGETINRNKNQLFFCKRAGGKIKEVVVFFKVSGMVVALIFQAGNRQVY
jgi:hypothetical protein